MINHYDIAYALGVGVSTPYWMVKTKARRKVLKAFSERMGPTQARLNEGPGVMIHAVSLGEMDATRSLVDRLRAARRGLHFIISTTTETGFDRGRKLYDGLADVTLVRYPLDFSHAVDRLLDNLKPSVVVLMELEVWPNFLRKCRRRRVPVLVVNGRVTTHSFGRYQLVKPLIAGTFGRLTHVCAQDETYAGRFRALGVRADRVSVTGTMKFDTAKVDDAVPGAEELAAAVGLSPGRDLVWACGSTGPGEEEIILAQYRSLVQKFAKLRLVVVPRHPERFDEVADLVRAYGFPCVRRSRATHPPAGPLPPVVLGDTIGELTRFYALADVVFVGRTLVDLGPRQHGSNMIEPAALGKPVVVGPFTGNFAEPMNAFLAADAVKVVGDADALGAEVAELLGTRDDRAKWLGERARDVVRRGQGATDRHVKVILDHLPFSPA